MMYLRTFMYPPAEGRGAPGGGPGGGGWFEGKVLFAPEGGVCRVGFVPGLARPILIIINAIDPPSGRSPVGSRWASAWDSFRRVLGCGALTLDRLNLREQSPTTGLESGPGSIAIGALSDLIIRTLGSYTGGRAGGPSCALSDGQARRGEARRAARRVRALPHPTLASHRAWAPAGPGLGRGEREREQREREREGGRERERVGPRPPPTLG
eukprot:scaffold2067_cov379-Prasinococcus_capsulatus_cf.AAC.1